MESLQKLINKRKDLMLELRDIDNQLGDAVFNMDENILRAWADGIIKFNFPLPAYVSKAVKNRLFQRL